MYLAVDTFLWKSVIYSIKVPFLIMKYSILTLFLSVAILWAFGTLGGSALAYTAEIQRFNNENWYLLPHPRVATFSVSTDGSATGFTENGISFVQYNIPNTYGIRVQRFEIQEHYHYIVEGEIVDSFTEFSALLARAHERIAIAT
jgi:hypothetical protein